MVGDLSSECMLKYFGVKHQDVCNLLLNGSKKVFVNRKKKKAKANVIKCE